MKIAPVQTPEGLDDAWGFIHLLTNPDKAKEAADYIDHLEATLAEINASIEKTVALEKVDALVAQVDLDAKAAVKELKDAREKAATIVSAAEAQAKAVGDEQEALKVDQAKLAREQSDFRAQQARDLTALEARIAAADARAAALSQREAEVAQAQATADALKADLVARAEAVRVAVG